MARAEQSALQTAPLLESPARLLSDVNLFLSEVVGKSGRIARELYEQALRGEIRLIFNPYLPFRTRAGVRTLQTDPKT